MCAIQRQWAETTLAGEVQWLEGRKGRFKGQATNCKYTHSSNLILNVRRMIMFSAIQKISNREYCLFKLFKEIFLNIGIFKENFVVLKAHIMCFANWQNNTQGDTLIRVTATWGQANFVVWNNWLVTQI